MGEWPELKMDPKIVHLVSGQKGSKRRQNDEVFGRFLLIFHEKSVKTVRFTAWRA